MFTQDISIVNKKFNTTTKLEEYNVQNIKGFWSSKLGITIGDTQIKTSDGVNVRILMSEEGYTTPALYQALTTVSTEWTLQNDDYIVKGIIMSAVTTLAKLKEDYQECMKVAKIEHKDYSSEAMKHYAVSGQ